MFKKITILLIFISFGFAAFAAPDYYADDMYIGTAVDYGLGGPYPTDNEGLGTIFANPASFRSAEKGFEFTNLTTHVKGPVFDIAELVSNAVSGGQEVSDLLGSPEMQEILNGLYTGVTLTGPVYFGYIGENMGIGLFNSTDFLLEETGPLSLSINLTEDLMLAGGYSFRIPLSEDEAHLLDIGIMLKAGVKGNVSIEKSFLELPGLFESIGPDLLMGQPFEFSKIVSADAGVLYSWDEQFSAGISFQDCYSIVWKDTYATGINGFMGSGAKVSEMGMIPFKMNAGVEYNPDFEFLEKVFTDFRLMAAYDDILDFMLYPSEAESWMLHLKAGAQLSLVNIFDFRVGVAEGLLNVGLGLDFKFIRIDAAVFGTERASQPNTSPVYNLALGFTI